MWRAAWVSAVFVRGGRAARSAGEDARASCRRLDSGRSRPTRAAAARCVRCSARKGPCEGSDGTTWPVDAGVLLACPPRVGPRRTRRSRIAAARLNVLSVDRASRRGRVRAARAAATRRVTVFGENSFLKGRHSSAAPRRGGVGWTDGVTGRQWVDVRWPPASAARQSSRRPAWASASRGTTRSVDACAGVPVDCCAGPRSAVLEVRPCIVSACRSWLVHCCSPR